MISDFAENLFFTRAAVEADSALANVRIEGPAAGPFGRARMPQKRDAPDSGTLTLAGLFRVWDDPASSRPCRRCGSRRLFLYASAGGTSHLIVRIHRFCPFCRDTDVECEGYEGIKRFWAVQDACRRAAEADAATPPGIPFGAAIAHLRALRDADLLDPAHPLEAASLALARVRPPVLTGHPPAAVEAARLRACCATPEAIARALAARAEALADEKRLVAEAEARRAALLGRPGEPSPKTRFKRGEMPLADYRAFLAAKRAIRDGIDPLRLLHVRQDRIVRAAESVLGRRLPSSVRGVFLAAVEEAAAAGETPAPKLPDSP